MHIYFFVNYFETLHTDKQINYEQSSPYLELIALKMQ
jgi:hypothetical protein